MRIIDLSIGGFGKLQERDISFEPGINILYGTNEAGKSTLHTFIKAMLYGFTREKGLAGKSDLFSRYQPWNNPENYNGILRIEYKGQIIRITRDFSKDPQDVALFNETTGSAIAADKTFFDEILCGLSETAYTNTISIGQLKSATDEDMVNELKTYITNMNTTGNMGLNITKASKYLIDQKASYSKQIIPEAAKAYASNLSEIRNIEKAASSPEYINQISSYKEKKEETVKQASLAKNEKEVLLQKIASDKQILIDNKLGSVEEIQNYLSDAEDKYSQFLDSKAKKENRAHKIMTEVFLVLGTIMLCFSAYLYIAGENNFFAAYIPATYTAFFYMCVGSSMILYFIVLVLLIISASNNKRYVSTLSNTSNLLGNIIGIDDVSDETMNLLREKCNELEKICMDLQTNENQLANLSNEITSLDTTQAEYSQGIEKQQRSQWELERQLEHLANLKDENTALKKTIAENERLQFEIDAIDTALETMNSLASSIKNSFGLYLNKAATELINSITGGIYNSMSIDENLDVFLVTSQKLVPINQVSSGTIDQIYLALRLAAAKLMQADKDPLPLIFDDSFVNYDDERLKTVLKWLSSAYDGQIIVFSCHYREAQLLAANLIDYNLIEL